MAGVIEAGHTIPTLAQVLGQLREHGLVEVAPYAMNQEHGIGGSVWSRLGFGLEPDSVEPKVVAGSDMD
jgi:hypothetical protein